MVCQARHWCRKLCDCCERRERCDSFDYYGQQVEGGAELRLGPSSGLLVVTSGTKVLILSAGIDDARAHKCDEKMGVEVVLRLRPGPNTFHLSLGHASALCGVCMRDLCEVLAVLLPDRAAESVDPPVEGKRHSCSRNGHPLQGYPQEL